MNYFVIQVTEDGIYFETLTKEELTYRLNNEYWSNPVFHKQTPSDSDFNCWPTGVYIIMGSLVVPTPKQVVTEYSI